MESNRVAGLTRKSLDQEIRRAELEKIRAETNSLRQSLWLRPSSWVPILVGIGGILSVYYQWQNVDNAEKEVSLQYQEEVFNSQVEKFELDKQIEMLTEQTTELEIELGASKNKVLALQKREEIITKEIGKKTRDDAIAKADFETLTSKERKYALDNFLKPVSSALNIFVAADISSDIVKRLESSFKNELGVSVSTEIISRNDHQHSVRYHEESDREIAMNFSSFVVLFLRDNGCNISEPALVNLAGQFVLVKAGVEIWLNDSCE